MTTNADDEQTNDPTAGMRREDLDPEWQRAFAWVERELGGQITGFERQPRWRPAFFVDLVRDGETIPLYLRGERGELDHGANPFEFEATGCRVTLPHEKIECSTAPGAGAGLSWSLTVDYQQSETETTFYGEPPK